MHIVYYDPDPESALLSRIAARVRKARNALGISMRDAASRSDLSTRFYAELEAGRANIAIGRLHRVAVALDVPLSDLVAEDPLPKRPIIALLGLRGAGKSTIGPRMAGALGIDFVELDDLIQDEAGLNLAEIFQIHGEVYYRRAEIRRLNVLAVSEAPCIVALSGGIVSNEPAFETVMRRATTVWLKASPEDHMRRVLDQGDERPVRDRDNAMAELRALLEAREPLYAQADIHIDTSAVSLTAAVTQTLAALEQKGVLLVDLRQGASQGRYE